MESILLEELMSAHLTFDNLLLLFQIIIVLYFLFWVKLYIERHIAFRAFKNNMILGVGTEITLEVARTQFRGHITSATKDKIIVKNEKDIVMVDTRKFMESAFIIHNTNL